MTLDYHSVSGVIERVVVSRLAKTLIPDMGSNDLAQEIRFKCFTALNKFDQTRIGPNPFNYLAKVADNHIYNLKRGTWVPNNPPCVRCPLWDSENKTCTVNEEGCDKIVQYRNSMKARATLRSPAIQAPLNPNDQECEIKHTPANQIVPDHTNDIILQDFIQTNLPENLLDGYKNLLQGKEVTSSTRKKLRTVIKQIIIEYNVD